MAAIGHERGVRRPPEIASGRVEDREEADRRGLRDWPLGRHAWGVVALVYLVVAPITIGTGLLIVHVLEHGAFGRADVSISRWFADRRTDRLIDLAKIGSTLSATFPVIAACAVLLVVFVLLWRRWHEPVMVIGALLFEKAIFLPATFAADRDRPPVSQLDGHPPSSSFFSGHVAAAVALYFGVFAVVCWHTRSRIARTATAVFATIVVVCVAVSRLLLGMHYASDVVTGLLVGMIAVLLAHEVLTSNLARRGDERPDRPPRVSC